MMKANQAELLKMTVRCDILDQNAHKNRAAATAPLSDTAHQMYFTHYPNQENTSASKTTATKSPDTPSVGQLFYLPEGTPHNVEVVDVARVCDGVKDCSHGEDERFCPGRFYCTHGKPLHIDESLKGNGKNDCEDGSDEYDSEIQSSRYNLINNLALQVLVWIMAVTALIGNLAVIGSMLAELYKMSRFAKASFFLQTNRESNCKRSSLHFSPAFKASLRGSSRFRKGRCGINGHRRLVRLWNSVLVLNLALADLLMGVYLMSLAVLSFLNEKQTNDSYQHRIFDRKWRASSTCHSLGALLLTSSEASVFTLVSLTTLRLHTVLRPFASYHLKFRYLSLIVLTTWVLSIAYSASPLLPFFRDVFFSSAWVSLPFPQIRQPVVNRTAADSLVRMVSFLAGSSIEATHCPNDTLSWNAMQSYLDRVAPFHNDWQFYGYYSENSVCVPKLYVTTDDPFWSHAFCMIVVNFISVVYIVSAYVIIYTKSSYQPQFVGSKSKAGERMGTERSRPGPSRSQSSIERWKKASCRSDAAILRSCRSDAAILRSQSRRSRTASVRSSIGVSRAQVSTADMQRRIALLVVTDCMCWVPICIMSLFHVTGTPIPDSAYAVTAIVLLPINSALNPLLYSRIFRSLWLRGLSFLRSLLTFGIDSSSSSATGTMTSSEKSTPLRKTASLRAADVDSDACDCCTASPVSSICVDCFDTLDMGKSELTADKKLELPAVLVTEA